MTKGAPMKFRSVLGLFLSLTSTTALLVGCGTDQNTLVDDHNNASVFESDSPESNSTGNRSIAPSSNGAATGTGTSTATETTNVIGDDASGEAARAIEEADIFKIEGDRLYALSQFGGLNIVDVSQRDNLRLLGRKQVVGSPFEMYVRDSIVFALYNGYGEYVQGKADGDWNWVQTSYVMAFDTTDAAHPQIIGKFPIPGDISDSRIVGDILYVVGFEANGCWNCEDGQHTTVLSLDVSSPEQIHQVDRLSFADDTSSAYSWRRSISVTNQRMYVAGPEWSNSGPVGSSIQVIDISDPKGDLVEGTSIQVAGSVNSRWQMDEYKGVLRVISQPGSWSLTDTARIQTYQVDSAQSIKKLANVAMVVPANETLRSVRFDGERAYAITAQQMDPLFTIDLSVPTQPRQAGSLEMPGWVYHMEPRGNRMVSLGYDQGNAEGALAISLFDVTDLNTPKMLDRVNFGGNWAWISEDQDRVQKAFQVLDASNLILMPFSGWEYTDVTCGNGGYKNGIQLVDWTGDALNLSGVASLVGQPRRGFLHDERLFAISEERVETFDISNRMKPLKKDSLKTAHIVQSTVAAGNTIVKLAQDWYTNTVSLDTTTLAKVELPEELGHIDLALDNNGCSYSDLGTVAASNNRVYLLINSYDWSNASGKEQTSRLVTVDVTSAKSPKVIGDAKLDFGEGWSYWNYGNLVNAGAQSVAVGNAFAMLSTQSLYDSNSNYVKSETTAHVLDVTDPNEPKDTQYVVDSDFGTTGLFASGSTVAFGYYKPSPSNAARVRFYVDRIDVADPSSPKQLGSVNVPGTLLAFDANSSNVVTANYKQIQKTGLTQVQCYKEFASSSFTYDNAVYVENGVGTCTTIQQSVSLAKLASNSASVLGSKTLEIGQRISNLAVGTDRLFMTLGSGYGYGYGYQMLDCMGCGYLSFQESTMPLLVMSGLNSDDFALGKLELSSGDYWSYAPMAASDDRVVLATGWQGKLIVVDGSDPKAPVVVRQAELAGNAAQITVTAGVGIASLYYNGVQTIPVTQ
jgi:uncharacterized secreted protein with C-terminal beta-propeller domain